MKCEEICLKSDSKWNAVKYVWNQILKLIRLQTPPVNTQNATNCDNSRQFATQFARQFATQYTIRYMKQYAHDIIKFASKHYLKCKYKFNFKISNNICEYLRIQKSWILKDKNCLQIYRIYAINKCIISNFDLRVLWYYRFSKSTPVGFEPTRGDPISLAGRRLSHSAKVSLVVTPPPTVPSHIYAKHRRRHNNRIRYSLAG